MARALDSKSSGWGFESLLPCIDEFIMENIGQLKDNTTQFFKDVESEIKKITWPSFNDTFRSTLAVIFISAILVIFLGLIDYVFSKIVVSILG